ncbi:hypothetical protein MM440_04220 [Arsenicicoccus piscis]|nr:hypothetical protein [Arsenicicoccus piscis]MCH8627011.1 hypothetical protein [Arsenicicoccus piscis]
MEIDDLVVGQPIAHRGAADRAAAESEDARWPVEQLDDGLLLEGTEGRLALAGEEGLHGAADALLDDVVAVDELRAEVGGETTADRGLARPHETDEDDHGAPSNERIASGMAAR